MSENKPEKIGRFPILKVLGMGGMGVVYLGKDPDIGRKVAIKVLHSTGDAEALERFKNEARTMGEISHPNIVTLLEYGVDDNKPFLVMEYLAGESLEEWMKSPHDLHEHKSILIQLCKALKFAHDKDILHRDLKPGNIQILPTGDAKLLDFGIAAGENTGLTATGYFIGTPKYLAPEILQDTTHSKSSDCYSLGLLAYTILSGFNPFEADNFEATMTKLLTKVPTPLNVINKNIPNKLSKVIELYLQKDANKRPTTPEKLKFALELITSNSELNKKIIPNKTANNPISQETTMVAGQQNKKSYSWFVTAFIAVFILTAAILYKDELFPNNNQDQSITTNNNPTQSETADKKTKETTENTQPSDDLAKIDKEKTDISQTPEKEKDDSQTSIIQVTQEVPKEKPVVETKPQPKQQPQQVTDNKMVTKPITKPITKPAVTEENTATNTAQTSKDTTNRQNNNPNTIAFQQPETTTETKTHIEEYKLPDFSPTISRKITLKTNSDTHISRGKTKTLIITSVVAIDTFKLMRDGKSSFNQVEIKKVTPLDKTHIEIRLYAQSNATMGTFYLVGYYQDHKTKPLILEVTL